MAAIRIGYGNILIRPWRPSMKAFAAALIAAGLLYVIDSEYNKGRYAAVVLRAVTTVVRG